MRSVAFLRANEEWRIKAERRSSGVNGELALMQEELDCLAAADLRWALGSSAEFHGQDVAEAAVSSVPQGYFDLDGPFSQVGFKWQNGVLLVAVSLIVTWPDGLDEEDLLDNFRVLLRPFLTASGLSLHRLEIDDWAASPPEIGFAIEIEGSWRGRSVTDLYSLGTDVLRLCETFARAEITRETVGDLVRGGGAHLLIGQPEGNWLDAKGQEYDLETEHGQISIATAVARFCNAEDGGLIVIGAEAKKVPGGEIIRKIRGITPAPGTAARYLRVLGRRLYPPPLGLRIELVPVAENREVILIDIPAQAEELKPFLVHGAIRSDGRTEGTFISIVQRRGEASIPITAPMIHSTLAAGRALLRRTSDSANANRLK